MFWHTSVKTNTVTTSRSINLNLSSIWCKALRWVFCGNTALEGKTSRGDVILSQTKLLERRASCDLNLCCYNIDTCDFLGDGVLDLDSGIDLDEVVAVLLVNQELSCTRIAVLDALRQPDGIGQNVVARLNRQILRRRNLNDLLVATLDGAITLVQMHNVSKVVTKKLDLNVLGLVEEALDEDSAVAEC